MFYEREPLLISRVRASGRYPQDVGDLGRRLARIGHDQRHRPCPGRTTQRQGDVNSPTWILAPSPLSWSDV